ncbi:hypothetical protein CBOM_02750 [Ceraceosorus bombacis]|uniref:Uncharacterized protein n=1 Tax=Ceraceosorus bombacis TaxID=401625 RepID=A0A0P1BFJ4_9BASI|nr:hypothetical protein CBOM_02750 [Ceraceosorus bombacis]
MLPPASQRPIKLDDGLDASPLLLHPMAPERDEERFDLFDAKEKEQNLWDDAVVYSLHASAENT